MRAFTGAEALRRPDLVAIDDGDDDAFPPLRRGRWRPRQKIKKTMAKAWAPALPSAVLASGGAVAALARLCGEEDPEPCFVSTCPLYSLSYSRCRFTVEKRRHEATAAALKGPLLAQAAGPPAA